MIAGLAALLRRSGQPELRVRTMMMSFFGAGAGSAGIRVMQAHVALCLVLLVSAAAAGSETRLRFDIPAQSLATALEAYATVASVQVFYESAPVRQRRSAEVKGVFAPEVALGALLAGTGLVARQTDVDAFTIEPNAASSSASPAAGPDRRFLGAVQAAILAALCRRALVRPEDTPIAVQLWFAASGAVDGVALVGSTGSPARDASLVEAMRDAVIEVRPASDMAQPITMQVLPDELSLANGCLRR
jgi:hypothetical protein